MRKFLESTGWFIWAVVGIIFRGYTLATLWAWFIVPTFFMAPVLSIPVAIGVNLILAFITKQVGVAKDEKLTKAQERAMPVGVSLAVLAVGYVVKCFM